MRSQGECLGTSKCFAAARVISRGRTVFSTIWRNGRCGECCRDAWRDPRVASRDEAPARANECPGGLAVSDLSIRCSYVRINL